MNEEGPGRGHVGREVEGTGLGKRSCSLPETNW